VPGLQRIPFSADLLSAVQQFDCGSEPWELVVTAYLTAPVTEIESAAASVSRATDDPLHADVWLYITDDGDLVGFGSLAKGNQRYPKPKNDPIPATVLIYLGADRRFHGKPDGPSHERFAALILRDLIAEARRLCEDRPLLTLYVDERNEKAIRFYKKAGFAELHRPYKDKSTGRLHKRM
jgi:GNAT superfamily N-acetyltransferase